MTAKTKARARGEVAGNRCLSKAERMSPEWSDSVITLVRLFARKMKRSAWTTEQFLVWAFAHGLQRPHDCRAVGPLIAKATRDGLIRPVGFAATVSSNGAVRRTYVRA